MELARTQKLRNIRKKTVDEITDYHKNSVTSVHQSGKRSYQEDSPVIGTSLYDTLKTVRGDEGRILDLVEPLFNQETEKKTRKIISNDSSEQTDSLVPI